MLRSIVLFALLPAALHAQAAWSVVSPAGTATPPGVTSAGSATDGVNYYFFGGRVASPAVATPHLIDEFWRFDGAGWTQITGAGPSNREKALTVWDTNRNRLVLFGGQDLGGAALNDTWEWDPNGGWTQISPATAPLPRHWSSMAYNPISGRTILFGGMSGTTYYGDTWAYDASGWTQLTPANTPSARSRHQMAFDLGLGQIVMFGGTNRNPNPNGGDTWVWNGLDWAQVQTATIPYGNGCVSPAMTYDLVRQRMVLVAGYNGAYRDETWEFDGTDWTSRGSFAVMPGRGGPAATFVPALGKTICYGGFNSSSGGAFPWNPLFASIDNQLYEYQSSSIASFTASTTATGCQSSAGVVPSIFATKLPWAGQTATIEVGGIPTGAPTFMLVGFTANSLPLDPIGAIGCSIHVLDQMAFPTSVVGNFATLQLAIPAIPSLYGGSFYTQGLIVDFAANAPGLIVSGRGDARIGAL